MENNKVSFRYSQSEMVAFLLLKGYKFSDIEISVDKKNGNKRAFFIFDGDKEDFLKLKNEFNNGTNNINLKEYINNIYYVKKVIKDYIKQ